MKLSYILASMRSSILLKLSNSKVLLKTKSVKEIKIIIFPKVTQIHPMCSINPLATWRMYKNWETTQHPNIAKPRSTLSLNGYFAIDWFSELMPKISQKPRIVWKIFIFSIGNKIFWLKKRLKPHPSKWVLFLWISFLDQITLKFQ